MATAIVRSRDLARCLVLLAGLLLMVPSGVGTSFAFVGTSLEASDAAAADGWTFDYDASGVVYDPVLNVGGAAVEGAARSAVRVRPTRATSVASGASAGVISAPQAAGAFDDALKFATRAEKLDHIFVPKHNLDALVQQLGSREAVVEQMLRGVAGRTPASGVFELSTTIGGQSVAVRGAVVDGVVKLGTAFTP